MLKSIPTQSSLNDVYLALAESHMQYADVIWGSLSNSNIESLKSLHDRAVSMFRTSRIKDNWTRKFLAVQQLTTSDRAVMVYKIFKELSPKTLMDNFHLRYLYSR